MTETDALPNVIAFQGVPGAFSDMACRAVHPELETLACPSFEGTFAAVREGRARLAMIPIENSSSGRVADIHHLLPESGLHIIGEHFQEVHHQLVAPKGASLETVKILRSHVQALSQCRLFIRDHGLEAVAHTDTAAAAAEVAALNDPTQGAVASELAARLHGLDILARDIHDAADNTTRFLIMADEPADPEADDGPVVTSFVFRVRSVPAALYKSLGGFATNGVNITKLESYITGERFSVARFYAELEGHPADPAVARALEELDYFSTQVRILGAFPADEFRRH